jgi:hypothetical protein
LKQSLADPNLYLSSDVFLMLLCVDGISMLYPEDATKAVIEVKARLSEKYKITNLGLLRQFRPSKSTARKTEPVLAPQSVLARWPSSPQISKNSICRMLTVDQLQWILM